MAVGMVHVLVQPKTTANTLSRLIYAVVKVNNDSQISSIQCGLFIKTMVDSVSHYARK